jgi:hypothetical protein
MVSAALVLLVAGMGVGFGWQPMPDGSPRYEYIVQVEPEMLETLAEGQTIPIVSDVPAGLGPIARVRVVVGRGEVPRRRIITQLKPNTDDAASSGVVLTQYTEPSGRYADSPAPPYGAPPSGASDPYTQAAPAAGGIWNGGAAPTSNPLRAAAPASAPAVSGDATWNPDGPVAQVADSTAAGPLQRVGAGIQQATAPIQQGFDRFGNRVRTAADNLGGRTGQLLEDLGHPLRSAGLRGGDEPAAGSSSVAPVAGASMTAAGASGNLGESAAPPWNSGAGAYAATDSATPAPGGGAPLAAWNNGAPQGAAPPQGTAWNQEPGATAGNPAAGQAGAAIGSDAPPLITGGPSASTSGDPYRSPTAPTTGTTSVGDPWENAVDPRLKTSGAGGNVAGGSTTWPGSGTLPRAGTGGVAASGAGPGGPVIGNANGAMPPGAGTVAISSGMFELPADRSLDGVAPGAGTGGGNIFASGTTGPTVFGGSPGTTGTPTTAGGGLLASPSWASGGALPTTTTSVAGQRPPATPASDARSKAAVIMAWVLLSGSAAGNIYLFWSYLDVRTKYRALVRKTARAVGSRFSPA